MKAPHRISLSGMKSSKKATVMFYLVANHGASHYPGTARCLSKPVLFSKNILWMPMSEGYFLKEKTER
jgi:hypothetical protein